MPTTGMTDGVSALLAINDALLEQHAAVFGTTKQERSISLVSALASSPPWRALRKDAQLAVRPEAGIIGVFGTVQRRQRPLVDALGWHVDDLVRRLRPMPYEEVEDACFELATSIRKTCSIEELATCRLVPLPRGGLIVAGILAYALGASADRVGPEPVPNRLTILIDDCAISGRRLREWIARHPRQPTVAVFLHAHPELCRAAVERESSLRACLAARNLADHAPRLAQYPEWHERWRSRAPRDYWIGNPDHVCYPWNEPDTLLWNAVTGRAESGWKVVPPSWCVKNRSQGNVTDVQVCESGGGPVRPRGDVIWASLDRLVVVASLRGQSVAFRGSAAVIWRVIMATGRVGDAASAVSQSYGVSPAVARRSVDAFVARLSERGILQAG